MAVAAWSDRRSRRSPGAPRHIVVDAAFDKRQLIAGIGIGTGKKDGVVTLSRFMALPASTSLEAEALAVLAGIDYANMCDFRPGAAEVLTDCAPLVRVVRGEGGGLDPFILDMLREGLADHRGLALRRTNRQRVHPAHVASRMALKVWRAGAEAAREGVI